MNNEKFTQLINSGIRSNKLITCIYKYNKILDFQQAGFIDGDNKSRVIHSRDDVALLFGNADSSFPYLRNLIVSIDENFINSTTTKRTQSSSNDKLSPDYGKGVLGYNDKDFSVSNLDRAIEETTKSSSNDKLSPDYGKGVLGNDDKDFSVYNLDRAIKETTKSSSNDKLSPDYGKGVLGYSDKEFLVYNGLYNLDTAIEEFIQYCSNKSQEIWIYYKQGCCHRGSYPYGFCVIGFCEK